LETLARGLCVLLMLTQVTFAQAAEPAKAEVSKQKAEAPKQKVLGLRIEGLELAAKDREDLFKVVQQRLKAYPSIELVRPPDEELTDLMIDLGCFDIDVDCLTKVGRKRLSDRVFYAQVDVIDEGFRLTVRLIDVTKGNAERDRQAVVKNQADLTTVLEREIVAAFGEPPPPPPKEGLLIIESEAGAKIYIDAAFAGAGRVKLKKPAGLYAVRVEKPGYEGVLFRVDLQAGETVKKVAKLKAVAPVKAGPKPVVVTPVKASEVGAVESPEFYETWWFWTAVGAVVVSATVAGVALGTGDEAVPTGDLQISVDPAAAWRDFAIRAGGAQ
jgi:hypothetical protein